MHQILRSQDGGQTGRHQTLIQFRPLGHLSPVHGFGYATGQPELEITGGLPGDIAHKLFS